MKKPLTFYTIILLFLVSLIHSLTGCDSSLREKNYFTIGSTKDDVLRIQGQPDRFSGYTWYYGRKKMTKKKKTSSNASVAFGIDGRVKKWTDSDGILNAQLELSERKYE